MEPGVDLRRDGPAWFLLTFLFLDVAWSITAAEWCEGLHVLQAVVVGGVLVGALLGRSRWRGSFAHLYGGLFGFVATLLLVGTLLPQDLSWADRLRNLADRLAAFWQVLVTQGTNYDNLMFVLELMVVLGLLSYVGAWRLFRKRQVWPAILPGAVALLVNLLSTASTGLNAYLVLYLLGALVLVVQVNMAGWTAEWRQRGVRFGPEVGFDLARYGLLLSLLLLGVAWLTPAAAASEPLLRLTRGLEEPWDAFMDEWNRLFAALNYQVFRPGDWFGESIELGGPVDLGDEPIADVTNVGIRYWRAMVYDQYTGRGWFLSEVQEGPAGPEAPAYSLPPFAMREVLSQTVTVYSPGNRLLIGAAQPLPVVSIPARAELYFLPREGATAELPPPDLFALYSRTRLRTGDTYWIWSSVTAADAQSLRMASEEYPAWVAQRYLQLPETLPRRVRELAEEITAPHHNAYDKVAALERFLRTYPYNEGVAAPPPGRDGVDYFLFDSREGYCNYYASALAVMARAVGIPARMVAGYTGGEHVPESGVYRIRERDAHAWVEVFFPGYGWVEFEPTAARPAIVRRERPTAPLGPLGGPEVEPPESRLEQEDKFGPAEDLGAAAADTAGQIADWAALAREIGRSLGLAAGVVVPVLLAAWLAWRRWGLGSVSSIERAYGRLLQYAQWLGLATEAHRTPLELAAQLAAVVPEVSAPVGQLVGYYVRYRYSGRALSPEEEMEAVAAWLSLRAPLARALAQRLWHEVRRRGSRLTQGFAR
ncbi:MAG: transglutaminase domain-containing protein [Anaerolineae bacterium]|nr:transglutaminase domain-containing protein [Anaerolineae bacterium]